VNYSSKCARCGATITLVPPWMHPVYSCDCGPSDLVFAFSTSKQALQENIKMQPKPVKPIPCLGFRFTAPDELTPIRIARMFYHFREQSIQHAKTCGLCKAVAEQGLVCPDLEELRLGRNKWLAMMIAYPQDERHG